MRIFSLSARHLVRTALFSSVLILAACGDKPQQGPGEMKVPVSVVQVQPTRTQISTELPGRVDAIKDAQIRARVTGIVESINFEQGSSVKAGDLLFTIDPASYDAVRAQAAAQLKRAQADAQSARLLSQRYAKLIKANAVSRQEYDNAIAAAAQAEAAIAAAQATLQSADIDLGYTRVTSPIDGRIGESLVTEGALVSATQATQLATVQQLDQVYVDVNRSTIELAQLRRALASGQLQQVGEDEAKVMVILEDGTEYDQPGKLLFSGVMVDPTTGTVRLRAIFPNDDHILLPGMYARVRLMQGIDEHALLVPQQALQRTADGLSSLTVVREEKATVVPVSVGGAVDGNWIITKGLNAGDMVVVAGFQKIRPGVPVQPIPWQPGKEAELGHPQAAGAPEGQPSSADGASTASPGDQSTPADAAPSDTNP